MKSTILKKTITMLLALTLVFSLAATASAGSRQWTADGYSYGATLTASNSTVSYTRTNFLEYHVSGTATTITATSDTIYSKNASKQFGSVYDDNIKSLMRSDGFADTCAYRVAPGDRITVPVSEPTGNYYIAVGFPGNKITITVRCFKTDADGNPYLVESKTLSSDYTPKTTGICLQYIKG